MCVEYPTDEFNESELRRWMPPDIKAEHDEFDVKLAEGGTFKVVKCKHCGFSSTIFMFYNFVTDEYLPDEILCWHCDSFLGV